MALTVFCLIYSTVKEGHSHAGSDGSMSASGSIPGGIVNFHLKIFNLGTRRGGNVYFLIARLYITVLGLNSKPFHSIYVEKAYNTVDSDSSVGWGC